MRIPYRKPGKFSQIKPDPLLSEAKFAELKNRLLLLKTQQPGAANEVSRLAEMGDFSENAAYQMAKGRLRGLNQKIMELEYQLERAIIITPKKTDTIEIGSTVTVTTGKTKKIYQILGSAETDPQKGIISHTSPIGAALLGKKIGDMIAIHISGKKVVYTVISF